MGSEEINNNVVENMVTDENGGVDVIPNTAAKIAYPECLNSFYPTTVVPVDGSYEFNESEYKEIPVGLKRLLLVFKGNTLYNIYEERTQKENKNRFPKIIKPLKIPARNELNNKKMKDSIHANVKGMEDVLDKNYGFTVFAVMLTENITFFDMYVENDLKLLSHTWYERLNILSKYEFENPHVIFMNNKAGILSRSSFHQGKYYLRSLYNEHLNYTEDYLPQDRKKYVHYACVGSCMYNYEKSKVFYKNRDYKFTDYEYVYNNILIYMKTVHPQTLENITALEANIDNRDEFVKQLNKYKDIMVEESHQKKQFITLNYIHPEKMYLIAGMDDRGKRLKVFTLARKMTNFDPSEVTLSDTVFDTSLPLPMSFDETLSTRVDKIEYFNRWYFTLCESDFYNETKLIDACEIKKSYSLEEIKENTSDIVMENINRCNEYNTNKHMEEFQKAYNALKEILLYIVSITDDSLENRNTIKNFDDIYDYGVNKLESVKSKKRHHSNSTDECSDVPTCKKIKNQ